MKSDNVTFHKSVRSIAILSLLSLLFQIGMAGGVLAHSHNQRSGSQGERGTRDRLTDTDRSLWLADFQQLINEMSSHYANLEWAVSSRHMNLAELRSHTEARIRTAASDGDERTIFSKFIDSFGDGHLGIRWPTIKADAGHQEADAT